MDIREIFIKFSTDEQCLEYIEKMRWPDGVVRCPTCGDKDVQKYERPIHDPEKRRSKKRDEKRAQRANRRGWFYICHNADCRQQFSPTAGTLFHDTHLPLITWFHAIALMLNAKKGISAKQLQRDLGIGGYKTAWYLNHRIREAMAEGAIPKLGGVIEIDETYLGGRQRGSYRQLKNKDCVVGMRQRQGPLRLVHAKEALTKGKMYDMIVGQVDGKATEVIMTDESKLYNFNLTQFQKRHKTVKHSRKEYFRRDRKGGPDIHTNSIESAFSLFKRGIIGQFHKVSIKHLQRYLDEFTYRFNRRKDDGAFIETVRRLCGFKPMPFATLTSEASVPF